MLERDDWKHLDALLDEALELPDHEREAFAERAFGSDREGRDRLLRLLEHAKETATDARFEPGGGLRGPVFEGLADELEGGGGASVLEPGSTLGRYVVKGVLGEGGMGRVYRAVDGDLEREVAIKAVTGDLQDDTARLRRFEREARVLATLNHPNVGAIYGFEMIGGAPYLILELIEGETLAERLKRGALPLGEALAVGVQVADALQEAHRHGIVHRDLKPSNISVSDSGRVKVLDFGIAKPLASETEGDPSEERPENPTTLPGTLLGTAPYMSPEQVRGLPVDTRSDVWSFGCVLYEMLTGRRAFEGHTSSDFLAAVLRDEPDFTLLPPETPRGVRRLLRRCLRKDPRDRQQDAGDARLELTEAATDDPPPVPAPRSVRGLALGGVALAAGVAVLTAAGVRRCDRAGGPADHGLVRLALEMPAGVTLSDDYASPFDLSRDGSRLVLVGRQDGVQQLYLRDVGQLVPTPIKGTAGGWQPTLAPDGRAVAFFAERKLRAARFDTGEVLTLAEVGGNPRGAAWATDGTVVIAPSQSAPLFRVSDRGGAPTALTKLDEAEGEASHRWPQALPGDRILFTVGREDYSYDDARLEVVSLRTGQRKVVLEGGAHGRVLPGGLLVFVRGGRLLAVPFDLEREEIRGTPEVVVDGVRYDPQNGGTHFSSGGPGTLVYTPGTPTSAERGLAFVTAAGDVQRILDASRALTEPRLSPDGRRVAVVIGQARGSDLWLLDVASGTLSRLTFGLSPRRPTWTPDGRHITVGAPGEGGWRLVDVPARGGEAPVALLETPGRVFPNTWTPDGRTLVYQERVAGSGWDLLAAERGAGGRLGRPSPLAATPAHEENAAVSPDGRFLAYESDDLDGVFEVYVRPLRGNGSRVRASNAGGRWPRFGSGGRLFYWYSFPPGGLRRIDYRVAGEQFVAERPVPVWGALPQGEAAVSRRIFVHSEDGPYDLEGGGGRFLMLQRVPAPELLLRQPVVVLGVGEGLKTFGSPIP